MQIDNHLENKLKPIFMISPSFYIILSGSLIGASINILTGLLDKSTIKLSFVIIAILLLTSSIPLIRISLLLEKLRSRTKSNDALNDEVERKQNMKPLRNSFALFIILFLLFIILSTYNIYCYIAITENNTICL